MRQKRGTLLELGIGLLILGIVIRVVLFLAISMSGILITLATWGIIIGVIIAIVGLVSPGRN